MRTVGTLFFVATLALAAADASPQRRGGRFGFYRPSLPPNPHYDGAFMFCRIWFDKDASRLPCIFTSIRAIRVRSTLSCRQLRRSRAVMRNR